VTRLKVLTMNRFDRVGLSLAFGAIISSCSDRPNFSAEQSESSDLSPVEVGEFAQIIGRTVTRVRGSSASAHDDRATSRDHILAKAIAGVSLSYGPGRSAIESFFENGNWFIQVSNRAPLRASGNWMIRSGRLCVEASTEQGLGDLFQGVRRICRDVHLSPEGTISRIQVFSNEKSVMMPVYHTKM
jgi:hypothetical protein